MRFSLWALTALILGALATHFLLQDRGYVLIEFRGYLLQMSVPGLIVLLLLLYAGVRVLLAVWRAPRALGEQLAEHRARRATRRLTEGVMQLAEGRWNKAEKLLAGGARRNEAALLNYLMAARAAQLQGAGDRRDQWLQKALEERPDAAATILLTRAELQFEAGEFNSALATLRHLMESQPDNAVALGLLARTQAELADWPAVLELLPRLKYTNLEPAVLEKLACEALERYSRDSDITHEAFEKTWSGLPSALRRAPSLLRVRALVLQRLDHADQAETELRGYLRREWHAVLVATYGEIISSDPREQLRRAEKWLDRHADDPVLLLAAARLCIANELWGKARSYLESSLAIAARPESYALYAGLLEKLGEPDGAAQAWRSGLGLVTGRNALPAPIALASSPAAQDLTPREGD
jgi:HemY protein